MVSAYFIDLLHYTTQQELCCVQLLDFFSRKLRVRYIGTTKFLLVPQFRTSVEYLLSQHKIITFQSVRKRLFPVSHTIMWMACTNVPMLRERIKYRTFENSRRDDSYEHGLDAYPISGNALGMKTLSRACRTIRTETLSSTRASPGWPSWTTGDHAMTPQAVALDCILSHTQRLLEAYRIVPFVRLTAGDKQPIFSNLVSLPTTSKMSEFNTIGDLKRDRDIEKPSTPSRRRKGSEISVGTAGWN